jgi:hypothetical protein
MGCDVLFLLPQATICPVYLIHGFLIVLCSNKREAIGDPELGFGTATVRGPPISFALNIGK